MRVPGLDAWIPRLVAAWRGREGSAALSPREITALGRALLRLQRGLTGERSLIGTAYMDDPDLLGAYLLYYWISSYAQTRRALSEVAYWHGMRPSGRVLDAGSGPGPATAAALDSGALSSLALDSSSKALSVMRRVFSRAPHSSRLDCVAHDLSAGVPEAAVSGEMFSLVVFSHSLNELASRATDRPASMADIAERACARLAPDGILLLQEPALFLTSRDLIATRDILAGRGWHVLGPCLRQGPCPALAKGPDATCHDAFAWEPPEPVSSLAAHAGLDRGVLKSCWFAFSKQPRSQRPGGEADPYRVVSDPMLNKAGKVRVFLCGSRGRFTLSARPGELGPGAADFLALGRGDAVTFSGTKPSPNGEAADGASLVSKIDTQVEEASR